MEANNGGPQSVDYRVKVLTDLSKSVNSGATLALQIQLLNYLGNVVVDPTLAISAVGLLDPNGASIPIDTPGDSFPDLGFRMNGVGVYHFNLKTQKSYRSGPYTLQIRVGDSILLVEILFTGR